MNAANSFYRPEPRNPLLEPDFRQRFTLAWAVFLLLSTLYCYGYALVVTGEFAVELAAVVKCVSRDWLIWALMSPLLIYLAGRFHPFNAQAGTALAGWLLLCTAVVGSYRIVLEIYWGSAAPLDVLFIYLPRYFFIATFIVLGGMLYHSRKNRALPYSPAMSSPATSALPAVSAKQVPLTETPKTLVAMKGNARVLIPLSDIICITASGNYLELYTCDNSYLMRGTMKSIEPQLAPDQFVRIHRSHFVRLAAIVCASRSPLKAQLSNGMKLRIGQAYLNQVPHFARN